MYVGWGIAPFYFVKKVNPLVEMRSDRISIFDKNSVEPV